MINDIYLFAASELSSIFGSHSDLESGNGTRFKAASRGKVTVYHADISPGNRAEIAFEPQSFAARLGISEPQAIRILKDLREMTGQPVQLNQRFKWHRVGIANRQQVVDGARQSLERRPTLRRTCQIEV